MESHGSSSRNIGVRDDDFIEGSRLSLEPQYPVSNINDRIKWLVQSRRSNQGHKHRSKICVLASTKNTFYADDLDLSRFISIGFRDRRDDIEGLAELKE